MQATGAGGAASSSAAVAEVSGFMIFLNVLEKKFRLLLAISFSVVAQKLSCSWQFAHYQYVVGIIHFFLYTILSKQLPPPHFLLHSIYSFNMFTSMLYVFYQAFFHMCFSCFFLSTG